MSVGRRTLASSLWNLFANTGQQLINLAFFVYLARLLDPTAFGIMALALVAIDAGALVGRLGLVEVLIREETFDEAQAADVFWFLAAAGLGLALLIALLAVPAGAAFGSSALASVLTWLAPVVLLQNLSAVPEARLQRAFGHRALARRTLAGTLLGGIAGVAAAAAGWGVHALAVQKIATVVVQNVVLWLADPWWPPRPGFGRSAALGRSLRTGAQIAVAGVMQMANTKLMDLMVAIFLGTAALGHLRTAWKVFEVLLHCTIQPLASVALVAFGRLKGDRGRLFDAYGRLAEVSALVLVPMLFGASAVAGLMMPLVFGDKWDASIPILQILGFMALSGAVDVYFAPMMTVTGHTGALVRQGLVQTAAAVVLTAATAPFGLAAVAVGQVVRSLGVAIWSLLAMRSAIGLPLATSRRAILPAVAAALPMWAVVTAGLARLPIDAVGPWMRLGAATLVGAAVYGAILAAFFRAEVVDLARRLRGLVADADAAP